MKQDPTACIVRKGSWGDYILLGLASAEISARAVPGQFLMVRIADSPIPLMRRPFSIHSRLGKELGIFFKIIGKGTEILARKEVGDTIDVIGPLGKGFDLTKGQDEKDRKRALLVGGGRGIAPMVFLAQELKAAGRPLKILYGGRISTDLALLDRIRSEGFDLVCSTDDGSFGFEGFVTDLLVYELEKTPASVIYACGPEPMLEAIAVLAGYHKIPCELSLESFMACGIGACWGCVKRIRKFGREEYVKICEDGPVFAGEEIIWVERK